MIKKTDYDTKITDIENKPNNHNHDKYITTPDFNTLAADVNNATLAQANVMKKKFLIILYQALKIKSQQIKQQNVSNKSKLKKLKTFDLG